MKTNFSPGRLFKEYCFSTSNQPLLLKSQLKGRKNIYPHLDVNGTFTYCGLSQIPSVSPYEGKMPTMLIPFNNMTSAPKHSCVHFFIDDYRFNSLYSNITPVRDIYY